MKAIEVNFNTQLYKVTTNDIQICRVEKIEKDIKQSELDNDVFRIYYHYDWYMATSNDSVFMRHNGNKLFLDLKEAQNEQAKLRRELFNNVYNEMLDAQNKYNKIVNEYYNLPLSDPHENKD